MILNKVIYDRAVHLMDDPDISRAYTLNPIEFQKIMYNFMINGVSIITAPTAVCALLSERVQPEGAMEVFDGDGSATYVTTMEIPAEADVVFYVDGKPVEADFNRALNTFTFKDPVEVDHKCAIEYYYCGGFSGDFSTICGKFPVNSLIDRTIALLAKATVIAWADKEKNFLLDIRNLLTDTDFKLHSPAGSLNAKVNWVKDLRLEIFNDQNKLDWDMRNQNRSFYGY